MLKIALSLLAFLYLGVSNAGILQCVGMTSGGLTVNVISDPDSKTLNVNGNVLKVTGTTVNDRGFTTENFINKAGMLVYYSMVVDKDNNFILIQFNSVKQDPEFYIELACH